MCMYLIMFGYKLIYKCCVDYCNTILYLIECVCTSDNIVNTEYFLFSSISDLILNVQTTPNFF